MKQAFDNGKYVFDFDDERLIVTEGEQFEKSDFVNVFTEIAKIKGVKYLDLRFSNLKIELPASIKIFSVDRSYKYDYIPIVDEVYYHGTFDCFMHIIFHFSCWFEDTSRFYMQASTGEWEKEEMTDYYLPASGFTNARDKTWLFGQFKRIHLPKDFAYTIHDRSLHYGNLNLTILYRKYRTEICFDLTLEELIGDTKLQMVCGQTQIGICLLSHDGKYLETSFVKTVKTADGTEILGCSIANGTSRFFRRKNGGSWQEVFMTEWYFPKSGMKGIVAPFLNLFQAVHFPLDVEEINLAMVKQLKCGLYFECTLDELLAADVYLKWREFLAKKKIKVNVLSSDGKYVQTLITKTKTDDGLLIDNGVLIRCDAVGDVVIPDGVREIGRGSIGKNEKITSLTIPSSVVSFGVYNVNKKTRSIKAVYYDGSAEAFFKIKGTVESNLYLLCKTIYCKDDDGNYRQIIGGSNLHCKTKGFDPSYLMKFSKTSFVDEAQAFFDAKAAENPNSFTTIVCFEDGRYREEPELAFIFECSQSELSDEVIECLMKKRIRFGCDEFIVTSYMGTDSFVPRDMIMIQDDSWANVPAPVEQQEDSSDFYEPPLKKICCEISSEVSKIKLEAFQEYDLVDLYMDEQLTTVVRKLSGFKRDGFIGYLTCRNEKGEMILMILRYVNHKKAEGRLYYSGCHFCKNFALRAIDYVDHKQFFLYSIASCGKVRIAHAFNFEFNHEATLYDDESDNPEYYSLWDYDNFLKVDYADFEAG